MIYLEIQLNNLEEVQKFVRGCNQLNCEADLVCGRRVVDAKSFLGILSMDITRTMKLILYTEEFDFKSSAITPYIIAQYEQIKESHYLV